MSVSLPTDLIDSVLSYLSGTPSITDCALVCHSWLPSARYHLLPSPKVLHLDQFRIAEFLRLIDSPGSTLSLISFSALHLRQNTVIVDYDNDIYPDAEAWRSCTAVSDLLSRNQPFPSIVTSLFLEWVDWQTMSQPALLSLQSSYTTVKELELRCIECALPELCSLIASLTPLEKITIGSGVPFTEAMEAPLVVDSVQIAHPNLRALVFNDPPPLWMIKFFARAIQYTAGLATISICLPHVFTSQAFQTCYELLEMAGTSLREFKLHASHGSHRLTSETRDPFAKLVAFPCNTNLQEIEFIMVDPETTITLLVQGLKLNSKPHLRQLKLGLEDRGDLKEWTGSPLVDEALSTMMLKDPKLIIELPRLPIEILPRLQFGSPRIMDPSVYDKMREQSDFEKLLELKTLLPRTAECWQLEIVDR